MPSCSFQQSKRFLCAERASYIDRRYAVVFVEEGWIFRRRSHRSRQALPLGELLRFCSGERGPEPSSGALRQRRRMQRLGLVAIGGTTLQEMLGKHSRRKPNLEIQDRMKDEDCAEPRLSGRLPPVGALAPHPLIERAEGAMGVKRRGLLQVHCIIFP
jgi:hypothetical protein